MCPWQVRIPLLQFTAKENGAVRPAASAEGVYTSRHGKDTNRAAQYCGVPVVRSMALHHRVSALDLLEGCPRDSVMAVLSWRALQLAAALRNKLFRGNATPVVWRLLARASEAPNFVSATKPGLLALRLNCPSHPSAGDCLNALSPCHPPARRQQEQCQANNNHRAGS